MPEKDKVNNDTTEPIIKKAKVYTMPSKFYNEDSGSGKKQGKNTFLIVGILFLVVAIGAGAAYIFLFKNTNENSNLVNQNMNTNSTGLNTNKNTNTNLNKNTNSNTNIPINTNANTNANSNDSGVFANINKNTNTSANFNANININSSRDVDFDGLTDVEEVLFGTNTSLADTDSDEFEDGMEIINGYNPSGNGKLKISNKVRFYSDSDYDYSLLYPTAWAVDADPLNVGGKIFTSGDEFVTVNIQENPAELSAVEWYVAKSPGINSSLIKKIANWEKTLSGALSLDEMTVYYTVGSKAYVISYNINILTEAGYKTTFEMMYKSFNNSVVENYSDNLNTNSVVNINNSINTNTNSNSNTNTNTNTNSNSNTNTDSNTNSGDRF